MKQISGFIVGLLFGIGLIVAGMANPAKVIGFLDVFGTWDPSLAFVMIGGIAIALIGFSIAKKRKTSLLNEPISLPSKTSLDKSLIFGSLFFGVGWGIAGICPGPGLVLLGSGQQAGVIFVASMLVGMFIYTLITSKKS